MGIAAYDYDILNDYGETDYQIDLFAEIEAAYDGEASIFDNFKSEDILMAFFPCVRFENQIMLAFRGQSHGMKKWTYRQKMKHCMKLLTELKHNYDLVNKMFITCADRQLRLIMENPYSEEHFLRRYWCYPPSVIDRDRRDRGGYYKKPTQYWFLNCEPQSNLIFEQVHFTDLGIADAVRCANRDTADIIKARTIKQARSAIRPQYANRFIREHILNSQGYLQKVVITH